MPGLAGNYSGFFPGGEIQRSYVLDDPVIGLAKRAFFGVVEPGSGNQTPSDGRLRRLPCVRHPAWRAPRGASGAIRKAFCGRHAAAAALGMSLTRPYM